MKKFFIFSILCLFMAFGFVPAVLAQDNCTITTLPFTEGFESGELGPCLMTNPNNSQYPQVYTGSAQVPSHSGTYFLRSYAYIPNENLPSAPTLILPELDSQFDMSSMVLEFWFRSNYENEFGVSTGYCVVGVMDSPTDITTFTPVLTFVPSVINEYVKCTAYFSEYTGTGRYIAIKMAVTAYNMTGIDDIVLDQASMCSPVQNLALQNIIGTDVTINWQPNALGTASVYNVTLENLTTGTQDLYTTTVDTFYTFENLDFSTDYRAYVSVTCTDNTESNADSVDFSTLSPAVGVPYFEDFEGDSTGFMPYFTLQGTGTSQWMFGSATGMTDPDAAPGDAVHSLYISSDSGATCTYFANSISDAYAVFNIDFPSDDLEYHLAFDFRAEGEVNSYNTPPTLFDYFSVYMLPADAELPSSGTPGGVQLLATGGMTEWTHFDAILNNVAGTSKQIVFYWYNNGWNLYGDVHYAAAVDNIAVSGIDCAQPNGLIATDITQTEATLHWHEVGDATSWTLYYRAAGSTDPYTELQVSGDTTAFIDGLVSNTEYEFYVVSDCGSSQSNPSVTATFRTACGTIDVLPYEENFEGGLYSTSQQTYIACWSRLTSDNNHYAYVGTSTAYAHSGSHYLDFHYTPSCHVIAILPVLGENVNANDLMLTFQACHTNYGFYSLGTLEVGVMTDNTVDSTFEVVQTIDLSMLSAYTFEEQTVSLAGYTGTGKYIAFRVSNCSNCGYYIDDLVLDLRPSCMNPLDLSSVSLSNTSVTLAWTEMGDATAWNIQYDTTGFTPGQGANTVAADSTTFTVTNLTDLTAYDFYVQADCGSSQSEWVGPVSVITGVLNMGITGSDTLTSCGAVICDNGGSTGNYSSYCDYTVVIYPATAGEGVQITGTGDLSAGTFGFGESHLYFYEGVGTTGTLLADYSGLGLDIAVASASPITVRFTSSYYTAAGFVLNVECVTCTPPSNITFSDMTTDAATITWSGNADQYAVYLSGAASNYFTTTDTVLTISNLQPNSHYNVRVRSICGADSSLLSPVIDFTTPCDALTITATTPWTEDFESYTGSGNQPFQCWNRPVVDATYDAPFVYCGWAPSCHSGANSAELKGTSEMLVLPAFTNDVHELSLSFWATSTNPSMGILEIGVVNNTLDPGSFELVGMAGTPGPRGTQDGVSGNGNLMGPFSFANVAATNGRIALRYNNSSSSDSWNLDDFVVEIASDTVEVTDPTVATNAADPVAQTTATLHATITNPDEVTITAKGFEWKATAGDTYTQVAGTGTGNTFTADLSNLTPNTNYTFKAFITYNGQTVYGDEMTFTTLEQGDEPCEAPTDLHQGVTQFGELTSTVSWTDVAGASQWNVQYALENEDWTTASVNTTSFQIPNILYNTTYLVRVQAVCDENLTSDWTEAISVMVLCGIEDWLENSVTLFPNPAREYVDIRVDGDLTVTMMEVYDVYGKLITTTNDIDNPTRINVSGLADGVYFVRVTTEAGVVTKSFVKK